MSSPTCEYLSEVSRHPMPGDETEIDNILIANGSKLQLRSTAGRGCSSSFRIFRESLPDVTTASANWPQHATMNDEIPLLRQERDQWIRR